MVSHRYPSNRDLLIFAGERHLYVVDKERIFRCDEACGATLRLPGADDKNFSFQM